MPTPTPTPTSPQVTDAVFCFPASLVQKSQWTVMAVVMELCGRKWSALV